MACTGCQSTIILPLQLTLLLAQVVVPPVQLVQVGLAVSSPPGDMEPMQHTLQAGWVTPGIISLPAGQAENNTCNATEAAAAAATQPHCLTTVSSVHEHSKGPVVCMQHVT
jgi:hypothetical protein